MQEVKTNQLKLPSIINESSQTLNDFVNEIKVCIFKKLRF